MNKQKLNIYVLYHNVNYGKNSAVPSYDYNKSRYYQSYKETELRLRDVFGDNFEYNMLNKSDVGFVPDERDIHVLVIPYHASIWDIRFGYMWQRLHQDRLVVFLNELLIKDYDNHKVEINK